METHDLPTIIQPPSLIDRCTRDQKQAAPPLRGVCRVDSISDMTNFPKVTKALKALGGKPWEQRAVLSDLMAGDVHKPDPALSIKPSTQLKNAVGALSPTDRFYLAVEFEFCPVHFIDNEVCHDSMDPECLSDMKRAYPGDYTD